MEQSRFAPEPLHAPVTEIVDRVRRYAENAKSANTRKAYLSPWCDGQNTHIKYFLLYVFVLLFPLTVTVSRSWWV